MNAAVLSISPKERAVYLDGLRGIAALAVVFDHFFSAFTPAMASVDFFPFLNGALAVSVFFVISGYVMSASSEFQHESILMRAVKRYARLAIPMLVAALIAWTLLAAFPGAAPSLGSASGSSWAANRFNSGPGVFSTVLSQPLFWAFTGKEVYLDPPMWTMAPELAGSLGIFLLYGLMPAKFRLHAAIALGVIGAAALVHWMVSFSAGAIFWMMRERLARIKLPGAFIMALAYIVGAIGPSALDRAHLRGHAIVLTVCAILLVGGLLTSVRARSVFSSRWPRFLGRVSFSLYLIHVPIVLTLFASLYVHWLPSGMEMALFLVLFLAASLLAAWGLTRFVDEPVLAILHRLRGGRWESAGALPQK